MRSLLTIFLTFMLAMGLMQHSFASGFSAAASPPRYELKANPGQKISQVLDIYNIGKVNEQYTVRTNDWQFKANKLTFSDALMPGSCRPWVRLERHKISVRKGDKRRMRFEVHVPANAPKQECRFAILVEGVNPASTQISKNISMPVNGRLAVIVYLAVGGAEPALQVASLQRSGTGPVLKVINKGTAHGRLQGTLAGKDSSGKNIDFSVNTTPVFPGETRLLALTPHVGQKRLKSSSLKYPISLKGRLYWEKGAFAIEQKL